MRTLNAIYNNTALRDKLLLTLGILLVYRIGSLIPLPGVSYTAITECTNLSSESPLTTLLTIFGGGALFQLSLFALGIMPYITASIIMQLLRAIVPSFAILHKEGDTGRQKLTQYTRYLTVTLATIQGVGLILVAKTPGTLFPNCNEPLFINTTLASIIPALLAIIAGAIVCMWFGEIITERGIGNGMSLLIFASIIATLPGQLFALSQTQGPIFLLAILATLVALLTAVVFVEQAQRRIPLVYARSSTSLAASVLARSEIQKSTYLPFKVNMSGVVPVIFASSLMFIPQILVTVSGSTSGWAEWISQNLTNGSQPLYLILFVISIIFFSFFYLGMTVNPDELADDLNKAGAYVPDKRPGRPTADYLAYVLERLNTTGSLFLAFIAAVPIFFFGILGINQSFMYGGISLLILAGVSLDTIRTIRTQVDEYDHETLLSTVDQQDKVGK